MESPCALGCWATVQSVIAGVERSGAPRAGGDVSSATNSSTSGVASGGTEVGRCNRKPRPVPGPKTKRDGELISVRPSSSRLSSFRLSFLSCGICGGALLWCPLFCPWACPSCPSICRPTCHLGRRQKTTSRRREQWRTATRVPFSYLDAPSNVHIYTRTPGKLECDCAGPAKL